MAAAWAVEEMQGVDLHDKRLNDRLTQVLSDLGDRPTASIPAACGGHAEMTAAYRFFDNDKASVARILAPHHARTRERVRAQPVVLCVQDTSEIDLTRPQQPVAGAGPLATAARQGLFLHLLHAFTPDGTPLGQVWAHTWARDPATLTQSAEAKRQERKAAPIEDKESFRWLAGFRQTRDLATDCPGVCCVCVADSEADIFEVFAEPRGETNPAHFLIRLCQERALVTSAASGQARLLEERVAATAPLYTAEIAVRGRAAKVTCEKRGRRQPREDRTAVVTVRATTLTLRPPARPDRVLPPVTVNVVLVREEQPPAGDVAVEWLLVTTLPIATVEEVQLLVEYYRTRWLIEVLFRVLKSGCRIEARRFEQLVRLERCLAVYSIVAWRTLFVCRLARSEPDRDCATVFTPAEWQAVWVVLRQEAPPAQPPRLADMVRLIAQLGGYVDRPQRADPPGPQTVWLGLQRMRDLAWAWEAFGPGAKKVV